LAAELKLYARKMGGIAIDAERWRRVRGRRERSRNYAFLTGRGGKM